MACRPRLHLAEAGRASHRSHGVVRDARRCRNHATHALAPARQELPRRPYLPPGRLPRPASRGLPRMRSTGTGQSADDSARTRADTRAHRQAATIGPGRSHPREQVRLLGFELFLGDGAAVAQVGEAGDGGSGVGRGRPGRGRRGPQACGRRAAATGATTGAAAAAATGAGAIPPSRRSATFSVHDGVPELDRRGDAQEAVLAGTSGRRQQGDVAVARACRRGTRRSTSRRSAMTAASSSCASGQPFLAQDAHVRDRELGRPPGDDVVDDPAQPAEQQPDGRDVHGRAEGSADGPEEPFAAAGRDEPTAPRRR